MKLIREHSTTSGTTRLYICSDTGNYIASFDDDPEGLTQANKYFDLLVEKRNMKPEILREDIINNKTK